MTSVIPPAVPQRPIQTYGQPRQPKNILPNPEELAARIEEARNSAKLLTQFVQSTPPIELEDNDLVKEFLDRCRTGSRIIQGYIHATNPPPDEDTLLTLIETNDEISGAISQQQRAMLKARKIRGSSSPSSSNVNSPSPTPMSQPVASRANSSPASAPSPPPRTTRSPEPAPAVAELPNTVMTGGRAPAPAASASTSRYEYNAADFQVRNPFADDYATNESNDTDRNRQGAADRVRSQPSEQER